MAFFRRSAIHDEDTINLDGEDHAWWANREHLERVFVPKRRTAGHLDASAETQASAFSQRNSTESLFNWASGPEPDDPTHGGTGLPLDPYRVLGLEPGATSSEVVAAHRRLAKQYHPDQLIGCDEADKFAAEQQMRTINGAYQELRTRLAEQRAPR